MAAIFTVQVSQAVGVLLQCIFYGIYLVTMFFCLRCLIWANSTSKCLRSFSWCMLSISFLLWAMNTLCLTLGMLRSIQVIIQCTDPDVSVPTYGATSNWVSVTKSITIFIVILTGDLILIYRCWIIWARQHYIVVLSLLLWLGNLGCIVVVTWLQITIPGISLLTVNRLEPYFLAYTTLTIPLNVITTGLIVFRLWKVDRESAKFRLQTTKKTSTLQKFMRVIIESGLLYTIAAILVFCSYIAKSNLLFYVASSIEVPITGIAFNLIIIRVQKQFCDEYTLPTSHSLHFDSFPRNESSFASDVNTSVCVP